MPRRCFCIAHASTLLIEAQALAFVESVSMPLRVGGRFGGADLPSAVGPSTVFQSPVKPVKFVFEFCHGSGFESHIGLSSRREPDGQRRCYLQDRRSYKLRDDEDVPLI